MDLTKRARNTTLDAGERYVITDTSQVWGLIFALIVLVVLFIGIEYVASNSRQLSAIIAMLLLLCSFGAIMRGHFYGAMTFFVLTIIISALAYGLVVTNDFRLLTIVAHSIMPLFVLFFIFSIKATAGGYVFDFDKGKITFPGGKHQRK